MDRTTRRILRLSWMIAPILLGGCGSDGVQPDGPDPTLLSLTPVVGTVGTEVHLVGNDFRSGATVEVGGMAATSVDVTTSTDIFAFVPDGVVVGTPYDVEVRNPDETSAKLAGAFTAVEPRLSFVNSATKPSGNAGSTVILEGDAFGDIQGVGQVLFSDGAGGTIPAAIAAPSDWTNTFIVTTVPSGAQDGPVAVTTATGTSENLPFKVTQNAAFSPSTIFWTETTPMPEPLSGHIALYVPIEDPSGATVPRVYVVGGERANGELTGQIHHAVIQEQGGLDPWVSATALETPVAFESVAAATPFNSKVPGAGRLFVIGGIDNSGAPTTDVLSAELDSLGNVAAAVAATPLPVPLRSAGAVVFRSHIYVAGGATTADAPVASVYRAAIDTLGALGEWVELESLPSARAAHGFQTFGGVLYAIGGDGGAVAPDDGSTNQQGRLDQIAYAKINLRNGDLLGSWTVNGASLGKVRSKHSALAAGGNMFVSAGLYAAAQQGSSENTYAQINSDGTVGSFGGATGSNTLQSVGAGNVFNHAAIVYVDGAGVAHVMILGGDDVNDAGTRSAKVFYY